MNVGRNHAYNSVIPRFLYGSVDEVDRVYDGKFSCQGCDGGSSRPHPNILTRLIEDPIMFVVFILLQ